MNIHNLNGVALSEQYYPFSIKYDRVHPEMIDKFSLTLFRLQVDLNFGLLQKGLDKQECSVASKRDYSCCIKWGFFAKEDADALCIDECL